VYEDAVSADEEEPPNYVQASGGDRRKDDQSKDLYGISILDVPVYI
jgi:hypothetical protein